MELTESPAPPPGARVMIRMPIGALLPPLSGAAAMIRPSAGPCAEGFVNGGRSFPSRYTPLP